MKTVAVVPVRMGSGRLPGKVMANVAGRPLLDHLLARLALCPLIDDVVVATSTERENDLIEEYCQKKDVRVYRGSEHDVLDRLLVALLTLGADVGVLAFGDCPLIDPKIVSRLIQRFYAHAYEELDFLGNDLFTSWPPGMEIEVFSVDALADSHKRCSDAEIREHGTLYMRQHPDTYRLCNLEAPPELRRPDLSFEVDEPEDLYVIEKILTHFNGRADIALETIIHFMDNNPKLIERTSQVTRRWRRYRGEKEF
jgi:spore coat polysaccharide biosynthesis protein SpsF